ncbi:hypothetical protein Tco_0332387 [Tanacetum coccineum]
MLRKGLGCYIPLMRVDSKFFNRKRKNTEVAYKALEDGPYVFGNITHTGSMFTQEPGKSLVSVYNRFAQLMNDLERNNIEVFHTVSVDSFDDLFGYLSQFEKLVNDSRANKNQAVVQGDRVNIQSRNSGNVGRNNRRAYVQGEVVEGMNDTNETANDEAGGILTDEQNDFLFADASRMEEIEELSANICLMARIQPADQNSDVCQAMCLHLEIALNAFCRDQVKPLLNELLDHFDGFQNLFQRDIKEMKDAFEQNDVYLDEIGSRASLMIC